jgi:hypothetical protein
MLRKLIKHDMRAVGKRVTPLYIAIGAVALGCCALRFFTNSFLEDDGFYASVLEVSGGFFTLAGIMAILILSLISEFFAIERYYRSIYTDEGYLTMVIPADPRTIINGKLISIFLWNLITAAVAAAALLVTVAVPFLLYEPSSTMVALWDVLRGFWDVVDVGKFSGIAVVTVISMVVSFIESTMLIFSAITVGSTLMYKNKIMGSVLFYFVIGFASSTVKEIVMLLISIIAGSALSGFDNVIYLVTASCSALVSAVLCVILYILDLKLINTRFNIE